jgi:hypothetical protein
MILVLYFLDFVTCKNVFPFRGEQKKVPWNQMWWVGNHWAVDTVKNSATDLTQSLHTNTGTVWVPAQTYHAYVFVYQTMCQCSVHLHQSPNVKMQNESQWTGKNVLLLYCVEIITAQIKCAAQKWVIVRTGFVLEPRGSNLWSVCTRVVTLKTLYSKCNKLCCILLM